MTARYWHFGALVLIFAMQSMWMFMHQGMSLVTFDEKRVKGQFIHQLALHHASNEVVKSANVHFNQVLQVALKTYARQHHVVIMAREEVLAGGVDVTDLIIPLVSRAMRGVS